MQFTDIKNPEERKKLVWAIVLGLVAIIFLWWALFGFGGGSRPAVQKTATNTVPGPGTRRVIQAAPPAQTADEIKNAPLEQLRPISFLTLIPRHQKRRVIFCLLRENHPLPLRQSSRLLRLPRFPALVGGIATIERLRAN